MQNKDFSEFSHEDILYNRNEAGNYVWSYYLTLKGYGRVVSGSLAQVGSIVGSRRFDESWDVNARHAGERYFDKRNKEKKK